VAAVALPLAAGDLLGDEAVGGVGIGNAQKRLREAHQDDALLARQAVLVHEGVDAAVLAMVGPRGLHQLARKLARAPALLVGEDGPLDQAADKPRLVGQEVCGDLVARRRLAVAGSETGELGFSQRNHPNPGSDVRPHAPHLLDGSTPDSPSVCTLADGARL